MRDCDAFQTVGKLHSARGLLSARIAAEVGELCVIETTHGSLLAEVVGFSDAGSQLMPFDHGSQGIRPDLRVRGLRKRLKVPAGQGLLGRVVDGLGRPIDGKGPLVACQWTALTSDSPPPLSRERISEPFLTGQRAIDGFMTCGFGQRIALMAGSGVGKSTLLGEIAKGSNADVNVVALIGERGREVLPFLQDCLGPAGMSRSTVVVSTSENTPLLRIRAAQTAITMANAFRQGGLRVLFMMDSITRLAMSQREIGLLLGEPPTSRGYPPSVFQLMAQLLEQLGSSDCGSITGLITVLVDGDDLDEPVTDSVRSIVDGHIVLDRTLAEKNHFPAIDISRSLSRLFRDVTDTAHQQAAHRLREMRAIYTEMQDLIRIGAYTAGSSPQIDAAHHLMPVLNRYLEQAVDERASFTETRKRLLDIAAQWAQANGVAAQDFRATSEG